MVYGFQDTNYSGQHKICQSKQYLTEEFMSIGVLLSNVPFLNSSKIPELVKEIGKRKVFTGPFHPIPVFDDTTAFANTQ